ncbi:hypothetical protein ACPA54_12905 [Uniformispora flossi]|uniref:hypothetical protein n=1 Tax=Uniformispora flossi TaxID=3390723 RepID=UPI003C2EF8CE
MPDNTNEIPLYWSDEALEAEIVRCHLGHLAARTTFETVGGCPYCSYTPGERLAALRTAVQDAVDAGAKPFVSPGAAADPGEQDACGVGCR